MPGPVVVTGATALCTMGMASSTLNFIPPPVVSGPTQAGKIVDTIPFLNVPPFGECISILNPLVAAATSADLGVLTPAACIPTPAGPWSPGSAAVFLGGIPIVDASCVLNCAYAGVIMITFPGQVKSICTK